LSLSGEPLLPNLEKSFRLRDPINLLEYQELALKGRDYSAAYSDYWNSTDCDDGEFIETSLTQIYAIEVPPNWEVDKHDFLYNNLQLSFCYMLKI